MRLIFDADPVVYAAGFASETLSWNVVYENAEGHVHDTRFFPHPDKGGAKIQANAFFKKHPEYTVLDWEKVVDPGPVEHALQAVDTTIRGAIKAVATQFNERAEDLTLSVILSGPGNWREEVATIAKYKGNRDEQHKPYYYQQIRDHITQRWGASVVHGREADDEASIIAEQHIADGDENYVICTVDKDLDQIPGHHYDYRKHVHYTIPADHAERWFWVQALSGDSTDNIPGCFRIATKTAEGIIDELNDEYDRMKSMARKERSRACYVWHGIVTTYQQALDLHGDKVPYFGKKTAAEAALETARLVRMQKHIGELWEPPCQTT